MLTSADIIAFLGGCYILYSLWGDFTQKSKNWPKVIIGIVMALLITTVTIYKDASDESIAELNDNKMNSQLTKLNIISQKLDTDSIYLHRLDSMGIIRDSLINQPIVTKTFINNFRVLIHTDSSNAKLEESFKNIESPDYIKRDIALDYIVNNFPKYLSDNQIKQLTTATPVIGSLSEKQSKLTYLLTTQRKLSSLENFCKHILEYDEQNALAWHYLLRTDVNIDFEYIVSIIMNKPNHCLKYANIVQYAMETGNVNTCSKLLNSVDLVNFLINAGAEKRYLKQSYDWITKMIDRTPSYKIYSGTYFVKTVKVS